MLKLVKSGTSLKGREFEGFAVHIFWRGIMSIRDFTSQLMFGNYNVAVKNILIR